MALCAARVAAAENNEDQLFDQDLFHKEATKKPAKADTSDQNKEPAPDENSLFDSLENNKAPSTKESLKSTLKNSLQNKEKTLDIGGRFFYTNTLLVAEKNQVGEGRLGTHGNVDLYFDKRFDEDLRFFYQQKISNSVSTQQSFIPLVLSRLNEQNDVDQLWLKFSLQQQYYFTVGKQPTKLGTGFVWQPTDFLNIDRFNPLDLSDQRLGVNLIKLQIPFPEEKLNLYAITQFDDASTLEDSGVLLRAEYLASSGEYAFSAKSSKDSQIRVGIDSSVNLKYFDWLLSLAGIHNDPTPYILSAPDPSVLNVGYVLPPSQTLDRSSEWFKQLSTGWLYTHSIFTNKTFLFNGEVFYNEAGYTQRDVLPFIIVNSFIPGSQTSFNPLYFGKEYAALGFTLQGLGSDADQSLTLLTISNFDDHTGVAQVVHRSQPFRDLSLSLAFGWFFGKDGVFRPDLGETTVPFAESLIIAPPKFNGSVQLSLSF